MSRATLPPVETGVASRRDSLLAQLVRLARPHHWIKNGFIALPVPFAVAAGSHLDPGVFAAGLLGFCLLASAVYVFNDLRDAEADRLNPRKRARPLASGAVPTSAALAELAFLAVAGGTLLASTGLPLVWGLAAVYAGVNVAYSLGAKHVPLLDVFILGAGFLLRVLLGCALVRAVPSNWLLLCSSALALFLAFAKRRGDLTDGMGPDHRPSLAGYSIAYLDAAMGICAGIALLTYALYCVDSRVFVRGRELASVVFVAFFILDYLRRAYTRNAGASPVEMVLRSRTLQLCGVGWTLAIAWSLGLF